MLTLPTIKDGKALVLLHDLPSIQRIAIQQSDIDCHQPIPHAIYRTWYIDEFYPNKEKHISTLTEWLSSLIKAREELKELDQHRKTMLSHVEQQGKDVYYLRAKVYDMPRSEGCKIEMKVVKGKVTHFELLAYFPFDRHHETDTSCPWKSFLVLGKKDGPFTMHHPDGSLLQIGAFNSGKRVGLWKRYAEDGKLIESSIYGFFGIL